MANDAEQKIGMLVDNLESKGRRIPRIVSQIPEFPYPTFDALCRAFKSKEVVLQRFSYELNPDLFSICATPFERLRLAAYTPSWIIIPIVALALGYIVSWWFLLAVLLVFLFMSAAKKLYNRVIFRSAFQSELIFCFLYYIGQINICSADFQTSYYWKREERAA